MINRVYHLDRGFERLEEKLSRCGAEIEHRIGLSLPAAAARRSGAALQQEGGSRTAAGSRLRPNRSSPTSRIAPVSSRSDSSSMANRMASAPVAKRW